MQGFHCMGLELERKKKRAAQCHDQSSHSHNILHTVCCALQKLTGTGRKNAVKLFPNRHVKKLLIHVN